MLNDVAVTCFMWWFVVNYNYWIICWMLLFCESHPFCWNCRLVGKCR